MVERLYAKLEEGASLYYAANVAPNGWMLVHCDDFDELMTDVGFVRVV